MARGPLERAFKELREKHRIRAEPSFTCCHAHGKIRMMLERVDDGSWDGQCFYHLESMASSNILHIAWQGIHAHQDDTTASKIFQALRNQGLRVGWTGHGCKSCFIKVELSQEDIDRMKEIAPKTRIRMSTTAFPTCSNKLKSHMTMDEIFAEMGVITERPSSSSS